MLSERLTSHALTDAALDEFHTLIVPTPPTAIASYS